MATSKAKTTRSTTANLSVVFQPTDDADNVTMSLAMSRIQFNALVAMRKRKGMLSDQELVRLFIAKGLEENS